MLGRLGQFDGVVGNAIMLPLWFREIVVPGLAIVKLRVAYTTCKRIQEMCQIV